MTNHSSKFPPPVLFTLCGVCVLLVLLGTITAQGATYYVAMTGNDSNPGTSNGPWRNPQKCVDPGSPLVAGDTCLVRAGTYTDTDGDGITVYVKSGSPAGTATQPITIKSETPLGAIIKLPADHPSYTGGFFIGKPYYVIEGFDIDGAGAVNPTYPKTGIAMYGQGGVIRRNKIHDIGRTTCSDDANAITGTFINTSDVTVEYNVFYTIGRLRNGENGCSTTRWQNDHGIYASATTNLTVRRNIFYDTNRGWPIQIYKGGGGTTTNLNIYHNTFSGHSPTGNPVGHILLANTINGANIKNNISSDAQTGMVTAYALTASNVTVSYNLSDTSIMIGATSVPGVTFTNNIERSTALGFVNKPANDFHLTPRSAAIDAGTNVGLSFNGSAPDIGAYEFENPTPPAPLGLRIQ